MTIDFSKFADGLVPAIVQDARTKSVLMLGYMNEEAYSKTLDSKRVTFYSRSKERLWTKGEESNNYLDLIDIKIDCDQDSLLVLAEPTGPVCHKGTDTCWGERNLPQYGFFSHLEDVIRDRKDNPEDNPNSYVASLFKKGINKVAQKVGEEAVEVVIEAKDDNDLLFLNESADLIFHLMVLLRAKGFGLRSVEKTLIARHK
ncbi:histidine biosynthesis bifunctional protein HisIE [Dokdonia pacifica]|uniref:Histidine biosynthesis bifunctional protein HisIE n=1 Tax=Dokdonia pacifica TaxID=1627892 RepID=A0A239D7V7_9FLAO|nr:bifunctional phosphoribosyl-AMP cyclohydrolase/phosphoribosyl-ATP diphosphatase HisIE [Dokdonia pacifica]GGG40419.1 histidine biosynthesis bifunctional protein HisIE [Dokdonia pacifica]SNS28465.1 phosphoribosyl-ATP pyrophosphatase /phosphoribosyl-AMP cyclohydrolase [Dokdonia pacifica]